MTRVINLNPAHCVGCVRQPTGPVVISPEPNMAEAWGNDLAIIVEDMSAGCSAYANPRIWGRGTKHGEATRCPAHSTGHYAS